MLKPTAIICEYNPFHCGHEHQINETKRQLNVSHTVAVMSSNFVQRGDAALFTKSVRATAALACGVDLVLELPAAPSLSSAENFAFGGVAIAEALNVCNILSFGSECGDTARLTALAHETQLDRSAIDSGAPYHAAVSPPGNPLSPNDILAAEYIRALRKAGSNIVPHAVLRVGTGHDADTAGEGFASASLIRSMILGGRFAEAMAFVPSCAAEIYAGAPCADISRLSSAILHSLRVKTANEIGSFAGMSEGIENRIHAAAKTAGSFSELCAAVKTKRYPMSRVRRSVLYAALEITLEELYTPPQYIRVLGLNEKGQELLKKAKDKCLLPIVHSLKEAENLSKKAASQARLEARLGAAYGGCFEKILPADAEYTAPIIFSKKQF